MSGVTPGPDGVLLTTDAVGGVWQYTMELARGMLAEGVRPVVAVLGPAPDATRRMEAEAIPGLQTIVTALPLDWTAPDAGALRAAGAELAGLAARLGVRTVHLHTPALAAEVAWSVPVVAVAHSDVGTWWQCVRGTQLPDDFVWRSEAVARGLAEADVAIAPSRAFARALTRLYRPGRSITVVPNGRTTTPPPPRPRRKAVLAAGRLWDEGKNVGVLDRAAARLDAPVLAAGPLEGPNGAAASVSNVRPLGPLAGPALAATMAEATVFASPARYEPFGLAVLEAAQSGMALALADIPTYRELWDGAAAFFHPDDSDQLAATLTRLLDHPENAAARARTRARRYSAQAMVAATLALHRGAAEGRPG